MYKTHEIKRNITVGATDIINGNYVRFTNKDVNGEEDIVNILMSSSAIPGLFPFIEWRNTTFVDGGMMKNFDPDGGILHCKE